MMNIKAFGTIAIVCAGLAQPGLAHALADCHVLGDVGDGGQDCMDDRTGKTLARGTATQEGIMFLHNNPGTVQSGMFGYSTSWDNMSPDPIEGCQIILDGPGDAQTDFSDCPGLVAYDVYGNVDL